MNSRVVFLAVLLLVSCRVKTPAAVAVDPTPTPTATPDAVVESATISVTTSGLDGIGLLLQNNAGDDLSISTNGSASFASEIEDGDAYSVTVKTQPICKNQTCVVTSGSGTSTGADVSVTVTCTSHSHVALVASSVSDDAIRVTDNAEALNDGDTAVPNVVTGATSTLASMTDRQNLTVDRVQGIVYVVDNFEIKAFHNVLTVTGDVAPDQTFSGAGPIHSIAVDSRRDRLYAVGLDSGLSAGRIYIFDNASTKSGAGAQDQTIAEAAEIRLVTYDEKNDRLYTGRANGSFMVYDAASTLTSASTPASSHAMDGTIFVGSTPDMAAMWIDGCTDRLYVGSRNATTIDSNTFFAFDVTDPHAIAEPISANGDSVARMPFGQVGMVVIDSLDNLLMWTTTPAAVRVFSDASLKAGDLSSTPDLSYSQAINTGAGASLGGSYTSH